MTAEEERRVAAGTSAECPDCGRVRRIVNYRGGDGSARRFVRHNGVDGEQCAGSREPVPGWEVNR